MIPKLFAATATTFTTQGIGALTDSILCYVDEERNGEYEGYLKYPITGVHYADIALRTIIVAKPNFTDDPQPFRVYDITKPLNGVVTVRFRHISYDLSGYPVEPFTASTLSAALSGLVTNCPVDCPFTLTSSRSVSATFKANVPASIRSWMGGKQGSLLDIYGGEWKYDGFTASLPSSRGQNRGVTIRYGKNLTALEQEENNAAVYTGVYPYWTDAYGENLVQITGRIVHNTETPTYSGATYDYERILPVDFSNKWESAPSEGELRSAAIAYIEDNEIGTPKVNLKVEFAQVSKLVRDQVDLCDTVTVQFEKLGVTATAKCIKTRWNVLLDRYEEITLGDAKTNLAETIVNTKKTAETAVSPSALETAVDQATAQITGANGGYIVWHDSNDDGKPDELLVMNTPSIATATKVWRFNQAGLGFSSSGYAGPYALAMTADGAIVADMITVGTLSATLMRAGILKSVNYDSSEGTAGFSMNLETGEIYAPSLVLIAKNYTDTEVASALATAAADATSKANAAESAAKNYVDTQISIIPGEISSAISEIRIGGRNLLLDTANPSIYTGAVSTDPQEGTTTYWVATDRYNMIAPYNELELTEDDYVATSFDWEMTGVPSGVTLTLKVGTNASPWEYLGIVHTFEAGDSSGHIERSFKVTSALASCAGNSLRIRFDSSAPIAANTISFTITNAKLERGTKATDWSPAPEDAQSYTDNAVNSQAAATSSQISQLSGQITSTVTTVNNIQNSMLTPSDVQALINAGNFATSTSVSQTSSNLQVLITQAQNTANNANSTAQTLTTGVTVDANGVTVGKSNSAVKGVFTNNSLQFQSGGKAIAWLSANSEEGLGVDTIQIGKQNTANQRWIISTSSDGSHLSFTRHQ